MEYIDLEAWPRRPVFDFFSAVSTPFYMVTFRQDVTRLYRYTKRTGLSFYYSLIYLCTRAADAVDAFHYAVRGETVVRHACRRPSFTDLRPGSEQFHIVTMPPCTGTLPDFCRDARARSLTQTAFLDPAAEGYDLVYFSCLPWGDLTALANERDLAAPGAKDESIPHIAWGRYVREGDRVTLGLSIEVNHRLLDGLHIGRFAEELTRRIEALPDAPEERIDP